MGWKQPVATIEVWKSSVGTHATVKLAVRSWFIDTVHVPPDVAAVGAADRGRRDIVGRL